jgi:hypothetical protein
MQNKQKQPDGKILISTRLAPELHSRIEGHRHEMSAQAGGAHVTFTIAIAHLVLCGLESTEADTK